jgi:hypothetical protein
MNPKIVKLNSGAELKIQLPDFSESKELYKAFLAEMRYVEIKKGGDSLDLLKNIFCVGFVSDRMEKAMEKCFARCLYKGQKIDDAAFNTSESREDYVEIYFEVAKENLLPFGKSLFAMLNQALEILQSDQA